VINGCSMIVFAVIRRFTARVVARTHSGINYCGAPFRQPEQVKTGSLGYFTKSGFLSESMHR
jgi:hypothetical protein